MADYRQVYVTCGPLPVHRDQLRAEHLVTSMGQPLPFYPGILTMLHVKKPKALAVCSSV